MKSKIDTTWVKA